MIQDKALSMIGLAKRAGKVQSGAFLAEKAVQSGRARLVVVATDASANTAKKFRDKCAYYQVPIRSYGDAISLGNSVGGGPRTVVSIDDEGLAAAVQKLLDVRGGPPG